MAAEDDGEIDSDPDLIDPPMSDEAVVERLDPVAEAEIGERLDRFLAQRLPLLSRARLKSLIEKGRVRHDQVLAVDPARKIRLGEVYSVAIPRPDPVDIVPEPIALDILYEDAHLLVLNKQAGLAVHPAPGHWRGTLVNALAHHCGEALLAIGAPGRPGIVHRLDKDTTGLMVIAKSDLALTSLGKQFAARAITRQYRAFALGAPMPPTGRIATRLGRDPRDRQKMAVLEPTHASGRDAATHYETVARFGAMKAPKSGPLASELICRLETGRTHQIRVHLSHVGAPLIGDPVYADTRHGRMAASALRKAEINFARQALHAETLGFHHPSLDRPMAFACDLPQDLLALRAELLHL